ncbi:MAG TPA: hypothetical protein VF662_13465 [Allosphingosinicella sp.]|jgi:tetratricopeptide (TPR) repeat protein
MHQTMSNFSAGELAKRLTSFLGAAAERADSESSDGALARGIIYSFGAFHDQAAASFVQALAMNPKENEAAARLVLVQLRAGKTASALETAVGLASTAPDYAMEEITTGGRISSFSLLGLALIANKRTRDAVKAFETAEEVNSGDSIAWAYLAQLRGAEGNVRSTSSTADLARRNPRFAGLGSLLDAGATNGGILSSSAVGAVSRLDMVSAHGRPLFIDGKAEVATVVEGREWCSAAAAE